MVIARGTAVRGGARTGLRRIVVPAFLVLASGLLVPSAVLAQTLFGPKVYTQTSTSPQTFGALFFLPASVPPPYYLHLENGKPDGSARVLHGSVLLNGVEVVAPRELGAEVVLLDKPVSLKGTNILALTLSGPLGGTLTLKVEARAPALTSVTPSTGIQGTTLTVAVVGVNTHFLPGVTQAWFGPGIGVGGAPPGALGPVTVTDPTHFTATLTIAPTTVLGFRTVIAKTNGETASLLNGFAVLPSTPALAGTTVSTLAGTGTAGLTDGAGATAQFAFPADVAVNGTGTLSVADTGNSRLRQVAPDGTVTTVTLPVALLLPAGVTIDAAGRRVIADTGRCVIRLVNADGTVAITFGSAGACAFTDGPAGTARFKFPRDVVADDAGNLYVADTGNFRVRKIDAQGTVTTLAGSGAFGNTDGPAAAATFGLLSGIAVAPDGTVFVTDAVFHKLRKIAPDGTVSTLAGTGTAGFKDGPAATAQFFFPTGLSRDQAGNLDLTDTGNYLIRRLPPDGQVVTLAGTGLPGSMDGSGPTASFYLPLGLAGDSKGKVFVADTANHKIRVLQVAPVITAISPTSAVHGRPAFPFTVTGTNLLGANSVDFRLGTGTPDPAITANDLTVDATGTTLTASVTIQGTAALGQRTVTVTTSGGTSDATPNTPATTFTVLGQLTLIPTFQTLAVGATGDLTVSLSAPAPAGGLTVTLTSGNPAIATVTSSVTIPGGATTGTATVTAVSEGSTNLTASAPGFADGLAAVTVISPPPSITGFTPTSGKVGTTVTITGTGFRPTASQNTVTFTGTSNTRVPAPVSAATTTSLTVTVSAGAVTGPIQVTTASGTATSTGYFVVLPSPDFTLTASPASAQAVPGSTVAFALQATPRDGFAGLVSLSVSGLPLGATATFSAPTLGPAQGGTLSIATGSAASGTTALTVTGTATIAGVPVSRSAPLTLTILAAGQTSLVGRILDTAEQPVPGVTIRVGTLTTTTDAAGNFTLLNLPTGSQVVFLDGSTASTPERSYPTIPVTVAITAGQVNTLPFEPRFHIQKARAFTDISNSAVARTLTDPEVPGFALTVPAGVTITGWDGVPNTQISVQPIPRDRLPLPPPPGGGTVTSIYMFYFGKTGGGTPSAPIPITVPNDIGALPGETLDLFYFDDSTPTVPRTNTWQLGGTGTVTADGKQIVTTTGGIRQFCCGGAAFRRPPPPPTTPPTLAASSRPPQGASAAAGEPVDLSTGLFILEKTDLLLPGRIPITLTRTYRTLDASPGPFGPGTSNPYDIFLQAQGPDLLLLFLPGNSRSLWSRGADGLFRNDQVPAYRGATITPNPDGTRTLRWKDGSVWRFDPNGRLISQTDRNGNTLTITRDSQGRAAVLTEPAGRSLTLTYDGTTTRVSAVTDPLGRAVQYGYDATGRLTRVTDPAGGVTTYTYDASNRLLTITDPRGITFLTNEYDAAGRVIKQTQADGGIWTFAYTVTGGVVSQTVVTDPRGNRTTSRFNTAGFLISQTDALGQVTTVARANGTNLLQSTTDPLGRVTTFTYDPQGNVTSLTDPLGHPRTLTYEPTFNKVTSITDPLGNRTTFEYDAQGNLVAITDPEQNTKPEAARLKTRITYNQFGQPISTTDPLGHTTTFAYDSVGNLSRIGDPLGNTTTREYDQVSRLVRQLDPRGKPTAFEYDALNRLMSVEYDLVSRLLAQTDPRGKGTTFTYDALNRLTLLMDPLGGLTQFTYDGNGNLLTVTDARGSVTTHTYDVMDRLSTRTDPLGRQETFTYDPLGNLVSTTDRKGQQTVFTRDALGRRARAVFANGAVATFTYDSAGRLVEADDTTDPHRPIMRAYDPLNRLLSETTALGTVTYQYDALGRRTQMTVSGQAPIAYAYDAASRLTQLVQEPLAPVTLQYDAAGRRTLLTLPNGVSTGYQYDVASRLTALIYRNALGPLGDLQYTYDPAGNRIGVEGTFARTLLPDSVTPASYDAANQQLAFGGTSMTFDANGSLLTQTDSTGTTTYTWDALNRLVGIAGPAVSASFAYDALGRRGSKTLNGLKFDYQYDGVDVVRELKEGNEDFYLRALVIDEVFSRTQMSGVEYYLSDALGSSLALTDATGSLRTTYTYEPFGRTASTGSLSASPFQFTGRDNDSPGLYYYRTRYYDPARGRFMTEDALGLVGGINLYAYVGNDPLGGTDPLGLLDPKCAECPGAKWSTAEYPNWSGALIYGKQGGLISFSCLDNGIQCVGTFLCGVRGPIAVAGLGFGGGEVTMAATGAALGGFSSGYTLSILFISSGVTIGETGNAQSSFSLGKSFGGGIARVDCETTILGCIR